MRQCTRGLYRISYIAGFSLEAFANAFSVPCKFIHDSECACNTELWKSPDIKNVTYISLNYHLGGAIIVVFITLKHKFIATTDVEPLEVNIKTIGHHMLSGDKYGYLLPFEAVSILLLACIVGGLLIARKR